MAGTVFVLPLNLIGSIYADLHGETPLSRPFDVMHTKVNEGHVNGFEVQLRYECETTLVPGGHLDVAVTGQVMPGDAEAERSCMMAMLQALRTQHNLFPADYNYIALSEKRGLFDAMRMVLDVSRAEYVDMDNLLSDCHLEMNAICRKLSSWIGENIPFVSLDDIAPVASMNAILSKQAKAMVSEKRYASRLCDMLLLRNEIPDGLAMLDATAPMPMNIDWENCGTTIRTIYKEVLKKIGGVPSLIRLHTMRNGNYKAVVDVSVAPFQFEGDEHPTQNGALAKLFYAVIKHADVERRMCILDFHTEVKEYQELFIERFEHILDNIIKCGEKLSQLFRSTNTIVEYCVADISAKLDINEYSEGLLGDVQGLASLFAAKKHQVQEKWASLEGRRVDRATLEAQLAGAA